MANSLFISHIPATVSVNELHEMFRKDNFTITRIKYLDPPHRVMVICPDQSVADRIIDKYNGKLIQGFRLVVEPWMEFSLTPARKRSLGTGLLHNEAGLLHNEVGLEPEESTRGTKPFVFTESSCTREFIPRKESSIFGSLSELDIEMKEEIEV